MKSGMLTVLMMLTVSATDAAVQPLNYYGHIAKRLGDMLPKFHVLQQRLNDEISQRAWTNLVTWYDFDHSVFLQSDLDRFAAHQTTIDDELRQSNVSFGFEVHNCYVERLHERIDFATNLLAKGEWNFSTNETYRVRRKDAPWPRSHEEADDYWRRRMKNEVLVQRINRDLDEAEKKARMRRGLFLTNSIQRSETFTFAASFWSITTRSLVCEKQKKRSRRPAMAKMLMVMNHAEAASGVLYTAVIFPVSGLRTFGAKIAMTRGRDLTIRPPRFAMNILVLVRIVISLVSRVREELRAP